MNKALLVLLIILLQIGAAGAGIEVKNATTTWNATFVIGPNPKVPDRITVEYANTIYASNLTPELDPFVPDRIVIDHANAVYNPYLTAAPPDFNPNVTPRIIIQSANQRWNPELSPAGLVFVDIKNFAFNKSVITIPVNTTITWINFDSVVHTVTANDGGFDSGNLQSNQSFSRTFNVAGTYKYHCSIHPSMTGTVIVTGQCDILAYYRGIGSDPIIVETTDLLKAADDWSNNITLPGCNSSITTQQLLMLADEWSRSG